MVHSKCEHGKIKSTCKECGGSEICEHSRRRSQCKDCGGSEVCEHGRIRYRCKDCGGTGICEHNKVKNECSGSQICQHGRRRDRCKDCGGNGMCEHNKRRQYCKDCGGSQICEHGRRRDRCKECSGTQICEHNRRRRSQCKDCGGSEICEHNKHKQNCPDCGSGGSFCKSLRTIGCRTKGNRKLNGYCSHCFVNIFPEDLRARTVRKKSKELQVMTHIFSKYGGFKNDKPFYVDLEGGCCETKRRIDLRKLIGNTMLCIEVDENQHKYYIKEKEVERYNDLFMDFSGKYIFIRYNPDEYIDKLGKSKNPMFETRMKILEKSINKHIKRIEHGENRDLVEIHHLLYDED